jgi:hypothetical protein
MSPDSVMDREAAEDKGEIEEMVDKGAKEVREDKEVKGDKEEIVGAEAEEIEISMVRVETKKVVNEGEEIEIITKEASKKRKFMLIKLPESLQQINKSVNNA